MKKYLPIITLLITVSLLGFGCKKALSPTQQPVVVNNFIECVAAGNPVMESYPRQCRHGQQIFIEDIGNELEKTELIRLDYPRPNQTITSPLNISGQARGAWFFEASFPVELRNQGGQTIAQGVAQAQGEWMTTEFVPFEAVLVFGAEEISNSNKGTLILHKDNPTGLPEHDDALVVPLILATEDDSVVFCAQDARLCPDGSYVGRMPPSCAFTPCPAP